MKKWMIQVVVCLLCTPGILIAGKDKKNKNQHKSQQVVNPLAQDLAKVVTESWLVTRNDASKKNPKKKKETRKRSKSIALKKSKNNSKKDSKQKSVALTGGELEQSDVDSRIRLFDTLLQQFTYSVIKSDLEKFH